MTENNDYISLRKICDELFKEKQDNLKDPDNSDDPDNYYKKCKAKFNDILLKTGIEKKTLKKNKEDEYEIPVNKKEIVKKLIKEYTTVSSKLIRESRFVDVEIDKLQEVIYDIETLLKEKLDNKEYIEQRNNLYLVTNYPILRSISDIRKKAIETIIKDMENVKPLMMNIVTKRNTNNIKAKKMNEIPQDNKNIGLNFTDKTYLLDYYKELIISASQQWKAIVEKVDQMRLEEILNIGDKMRSENIKELGPEKFSKLLIDSPIVIWNAIEEHRKENESIEVHDLEAPTIEQLNEAEKLIEGVRKKLNKTDKEKP